MVVAGCCRYNNRVIHNTYVGVPCRDFPVTGNSHQQLRLWNFTSEANTNTIACNRSTGPAGVPLKSDDGSHDTPSLPLPTAAQLSWHRGGTFGISALVHFNMATYFKDGDPGCQCAPLLLPPMGCSCCAAARRWQCPLSRAAD
jgi:hypothetical protein